LFSTKEDKKKRKTSLSCAEPERVEQRKVNGIWSSSFYSSVLLRESEKVKEKSKRAAGPGPHSDLFGVVRGEGKGRVEPGHHSRSFLPNLTGGEGKGEKRSQKRTSIQPPSFFLIFLTYISAEGKEKERSASISSRFPLYLFKRDKSRAGAPVPSTGRKGRKRAWTNPRVGPLPCPRLRAKGENHAVTDSHSILN